MAWSAEQYSRFENERDRPIEDLLARLPAAESVRRAADIGCGPGNLMDGPRGRLVIRRKTADALRPARRYPISGKEVPPCHRRRWILAA